MEIDKQDQYTYRVTWSEEDGEHVGLCAEFPGLSWLAKTSETALRGIRRTVASPWLKSNLRGLRWTYDVYSIAQRYRPKRHYLKDGI